MMLHDTYKVGTHWINARKLEIQERSQCKPCLMMESMEHIMTECCAPGQSKIWALAEVLIKKRTKVWPGNNFGVILSSYAGEFKDRKGKIDVGAGRLYRIVMAEAEHLIWKIWNERVIQKADILNPFMLPEEITKR
jgi:hypothetical protein